MLLKFSVFLNWKLRKKYLLDVISYLLYFVVVVVVAAAAAAAAAAVAVVVVPC